MPETHVIGKVACRMCMDWGIVDFGVSVGREGVEVAVEHGTVPCPDCPRGKAERTRRAGLGIVA